MIEQIAIAVFGVPAIVLSQVSPLRWRRWACVFGIASQPFWFYTAAVSHQWGVFALSVLYAASWLYGFYNNWIRT